jgi:DnaJ-class molecular chaperone
MVSGARRCRGEEDAMTERKEGLVEKTKPGDEAPPGTPGTGEALCPDCAGTGRRDGAPCSTCGGTGKVNVGVAGG